VYGPSPHASTTMRHALYQGICPRSRSTSENQIGTLLPVKVRASSRGTRSSRLAQPLPCRGRRQRCAATTARAGEQSRTAAERSSCLQPGRCSQRRQGRRRFWIAHRGEKRQARCAFQQLIEDWPETKKLTGRRAGGQGARAENPHPAQHDFHFGTKVPKVALPASRTTARSSVAHAREPARLLSRSPQVYFPSSARTRSDAQCSRRRAIRSAPTAASICCRKNMPAKRLSTRSIRWTSTASTRPARGHLRQGRQLGVSIATFEDMKVLYSASPVRPGDERQHDDQRPAPTILAMFPQLRHRPADGQVPARKTSRADGRRARRDKAETLSTVRGTVQATF